MKKNYVVKVSLAVLRTIVSCALPTVEQVEDKIVKKYSVHHGGWYDDWRWEGLEKASYKDVMYLIRLLKMFIIRASSCIWLW
jgi:hypothetical protein